MDYISFMIKVIKEQKIVIIGIHMDKKNNHSN